MAIRPLVSFPDQRLRQPAASVTAFDSSLRDLVTDLTDTMRAAPGVGITAPHIGVLLRVVVLDLPDAGGPEAFINPEILSTSAETLIHEEGSISMPGVSAPVARPASLRMQYQDLNGEPHTLTATGFRAACHQHETDQLRGMFWLRRLSPMRRTRLISRYEKLRPAPRPF